MSPIAHAALRCVAAAVDDLLSRAAAVNIYEICARLFGKLRRPAHADFVVAENLNSEGTLFGREFHHFVRAQVAARQSFDTDEFGDNQANATAAFGDAAKRRIGRALGSNS